MSPPPRLLLVVSMSGAGKTQALKALEDAGWETHDNLPAILLDALLRTPLPPGDARPRPLAFALDPRTRGFDAAGIVAQVTRWRRRGLPIELLYLDCSGAELERRYTETRRRHPLAQDRAATDGIAAERDLLAPLRAAADHVIDTSDWSANDLRNEVRERFAGPDRPGLVLRLMSFGFARGIPRSADFVFDVRYLRNPHWDADLRPHSGVDPRVAAYVAEDPAFDTTLTLLDGLFAEALPRFAAEGKAYVTVAIGCTGGRHRSVAVTEALAERLRQRGFSPTVAHRDAGADGVPPGQGQTEQE